MYLLFFIGIIISLNNVIFIQTNEVFLGFLGGERHKRYAEGINKMLKRLQFDGNFTQFLEFSKSVKLDKTEKNYRITLNTARLRENENPGIFKIPGFWHLNYP